MHEVATILNSTGWDCLSPLKKYRAAYLEYEYDINSGIWVSIRALQSSESKLEDTAPGSEHGSLGQCRETLRAVLTPDNTIGLFRPHEHAAHFSRSCDAVSVPSVPEDLFVASLKQAVYANGFYVAPHHSALQLDIQVVAFRSRETPTAKLQVSVKSARARHKINTLDTFASQTFDNLIETPQSPSRNYVYSEEKVASISTLHFDSEPNYEGEGPSESSFIGLTIGNDGETKLVIPELPETAECVTSASCEVLAQYLGWQTERRAIGHRELASFFEVIATGSGLVPVRSIIMTSTGRIYNYMKSGRRMGEGYKTLARLFDDIILGRAAHDFGWTVHSIYDTRFDAMSCDKRIQDAAEKRSAFTCRSDRVHPEDFYFALLPARRYCN